MVLVTRLVPRFRVTFLVRDKKNSIRNVAKLFALFLAFSATLLLFYQLRYSLAGRTSSWYWQPYTQGTYTIRVQLRVHVSRVYFVAIMLEFAAMHHSTALPEKCRETERPFLIYFTKLLLFTRAVLFSLFTNLLSNYQS